LSRIAEGVKASKPRIKAVLVWYETRLYVASPEKASPEWPGFGEVFV
jgi:hypothetical protein